MSRRLGPASTLEHLKKEAKRWLRALRTGVADARTRLERALPSPPHLPTLRDVQHALAREHGLSGWAELVARLPSEPRSGRDARPTADRFERMAANLLDAYRTGTAEAMQRHWNDTWHRRSWEAMRRYTLLDLGRRPGRDDEYVEISLDDARLLVARDQAFGSWDALTEYLRQLPPNKRLIAPRPVTVFGTAEPLETRDWDTALEWLAANQLTGLDAHGQMTDEVLERIANLTHVTSLRLGGSKALTDAGVLHLARMPALRHLDLSGTQVTDRGLEILSGLAALESVVLAWTQITDRGAERLSACRRLELVDLSGTNTGDAAIGALARHPSLRHFRSGAGVTDAGLPLLHGIPVFKAWHGGEPRLELLSPDAEPNSLVLRGRFTDRGVASLAGLDGLFGLNLDDRGLGLTAASLAPLVGLPNLGFLAFDARDDAMPYIAAMPRLRFLMCQDTVAGDDGFRALSRSHSIEYIWGRRCHNLGTRGFTALAAMPALRALSVSCRNVGDAGLAALPRFPALRELMPMDVPDAGYRHIGRCEALEALILMYCRDTTDAATEQIVGLANLERYFASYTRITDRTPELLAGISSLERVELAGCSGLTNTGVAALARLPRLRELTLEGLQHVTREATVGFGPGVRVRFSG